jgi:hypothetical protein
LRGSIINGVLDMGGRRSVLEFGAKIGIVVLPIVVVNVVVASLLPPFWLALSNLLFIEGAIILGVGAWIASGASTLRTEKFSSLYARPEGHAEYLRQSRKKQFSFGIVLIIIGAALMGLSIAIGTLLI